MARDGRYSPNPMQSAMLGAGGSPNLGRMSPNLSAGGGGGGFEVERVSRPPSAMGMAGMGMGMGGVHGGIGGPGYDPELVYRENVSKLIGAKTRPFSVSGRIPLDPAHLVLFFRAKVRTLFYLFRDF